MKCVPQIPYDCVLGCCLEFGWIVKLLGCGISRDSREAIWMVLGD
jgi:hypothetical protein